MTELDSERGSERRWREAGLLTGDGSVASVAQVKLLEELSALGVTEEEMREAQRRGQLEDAIFQGPIEAGLQERSLSAREVAARAGMPLTQLGELWQAFGLPIPSPDDRHFTEEEADAMAELARLADIWPPEVHVQLARVYGQALGHIAETELRLFRRHVTQRHADTLPPLRALSETRQAFEQLLPLANPMLLSVHLRWIEKRIAQASVQAVEAQMPAGRLPDSTNVTLLFCDLKDFAAYADLHGDEAAAAAISAFARVVAQAHGPDGHVVKSMGDGYFIVYDDPNAAVEAGRRILRETVDGEMPRVHAAVHRGSVVFREGDFFGRNVNLTARLLTIAGPGEIVTTKELTEQIGNSVRWEELGFRRFRGFAEPVEVCRLVEPFAAG